MYASITIAQDKALTNSKQPFSVIEKRCLYQVIYEVRKTHIDTNKGAEIKDYEITRSGTSGYYKYNLEYSIISR